MLAKSKLNSIEVLICKALIDSVISHDEFVLINYVLKECKKMKEIIVGRVKKIQKVKIQKLQRQNQKNNTFIKLCSMQ